MTTNLSRLVSFVFGRRTDWHLTTPRLPRLRIGPQILGPLAMIASCVIAWPAFALSLIHI